LNSTIIIELLKVINMSYWKEINMN